tara:strand:- start:196 stop:900 length:705 start_codon:yes stop_codon:yes gene_type:complete
MALGSRSSRFWMASMTASCFHRLTRFRYSVVQRGRKAQRWQALRQRANVWRQFRDEYRRQAEPPVQQDLSSAYAGRSPITDHHRPSPLLQWIMRRAVPSGAQDRIRRILASLEGVQVAMSREEIPSFNRVDAEQMRDLHLPKLVKIYIDIPAAPRPEICTEQENRRVFRLNESLDQIKSKIDDILRNLAQHDIDAFTNNILFIVQKYLDSNGPFKLAFSKKQTICQLAIILPKI